MSDAQHIWNKYKESEVEAVAPFLTKLGFVLDPEQPHTLGERFLMAGKRDVGGGGYKLVLVGKRASDSKRVIIKISSDQDGIKEIQTERRAREVLNIIQFAYRTLHTPAELLYIEGPRTVSVTAHIPQDQTFTSRPIAEQFTLALQAFKAQESVHATAYSHEKSIRSIFTIWGAENYLQAFASFRATVRAHDANNMTLMQNLERATLLLEKHQDTIEQYCGFLTHADFVPHNLRVFEGDVYLLDSASLHFGNKYESWARFLNFMLLYNRPLETALREYVQNNRTPEEMLSLRLMRVYKLGALLAYYASTLEKTTGDLHLLSEKRLAFWSDVLESLLNDLPLPQNRIEHYQRDRDTLRSDEEKTRQKALH